MSLVQDHPREIARVLVAKRRGQFVLLPAEFVLLLISTRPPAQQHQVWPIDGLKKLMADCYVKGIFA
jgi:hypothetical protein